MPKPVVIDCAKDLSKWIPIISKTPATSVKMYSKIVITFFIHTSYISIKQYDCGARDNELSSSTSNVSLPILVLTIFFL